MLELQKKNFFGGAPDMNAPRRLIIDGVSGAGKSRSFAAWKIDMDCIT